MRTTVAVDDELLAAARRMARQQGVTLGHVIELALRRALVQNDDTHAGPPIPVFEGGGGARPGIDLTSNMALHEALDDDLELDRRH